MEVSGQLHVPSAIPPRIEPLLIIVKGVGWAPGPLRNGVENRKIFCPYRESIPDCSIAQRMVSSVRGRIVEGSLLRETAVSMCSSFCDVSQAGCISIIRV
jgi:hypothetical protein